MGHHSKKKSKNTQTSAPNPVPNLPFDINNIGKLLNNVDINSMSNALNSMDLNQVMSVLSKAFTPPVNTSPDNASGNAVNNIPNPPPSDKTDSDSNTINQTEYFNPLKSFNIPNINQMNTSSQTPLSHILPPNDPTVMILNSLKPFLPPDKCIIVDNMIQIYGIKRVIDKIFPPSAGVNSYNTKNTTEESNSQMTSTDGSESNK